MLDSTIFLNLISLDRNNKYSDHFSNVIKISSKSPKFEVMFHSVANVQDILILFN